MIVHSIYLFVGIILLKMVYEDLINYLMYWLVISYFHYYPTNLVDKMQHLLDSYLQNILLVGMFNDDINESSL